MLVPFYFMIGGWGTGDRVRATTKFMIYTLAGSLLMLAAAVALGVLSTPDGGEISFSLADLQQRSVSEGTQQWMVLLFALAFFVKAPLFPLHGWVPETYRSSPIVTIALLSGVLSKVGVYGFLRIVLPVMPEGAQHWQELFIIVAVFSILYGSILAFSQDNLRLVLAYSSIAQLGFIVLGIFALEDKGAQGAVFQMLNHGLVVVPLFLIVGVIAERARGSESLSELGGMAFRAPVLAALFLIITFATLAMPGSGNFVGELLVLFGTFEDKLVYGLVASVGVVLAAVYMIRVFQGTMHNRPGPDVEPGEIDGLRLAAIAPLVAVIVALGVYPHFVVHRTEKATTAAIQEARGIGQEVANR
jgi:NADH-quinone oxidoreductase subunit M